jgi:hypothetical protein
MTDILVDLVFFVSLTSQVLVEVVLLINVNLGLRLNCWSSAFGY